MRKKKFKKCRTKADIEKDPRIVELFWEEDSLLPISKSQSKWRAELSKGFWCMKTECTYIRANTFKELCELLNCNVVIDPGRSEEKPELYIDEDESYSPTRYFIRKRTDKDYFGEILDFAETESEAKAMLEDLEIDY